jgi:hypothetical protein
MNICLKHVYIYLFIYLFAVTPIWVKAKYIHSYKISERKKQNKQKKHNYMCIGTTEIKADEGTGEKILCSPQDGQLMDSLFYNSNYRKNLKNKNKN